MKYLLILVAALAGCGDKPKETPLDLTPVIIPDLAKEAPPDLWAPDLAVPDCTALAPAIYSQLTQFGWRTGSATVDQLASSNIQYFVRNNGTIEVQQIPVSTISQWRCPNMYKPDPTTCEVTCCDGAASMVPLIYFSPYGWQTIRPGSCTWQDPNLVNYTIDVNQVDGYRVD